jgi:hypothetical protein
MRVAITALSFAVLACVFCYQNAGAVATSGTAIKEVEAAGSLARQTRYHRFTGTAIASVIGSLSLVPVPAGTIGFRARRPRTDRARVMGARFKFGFGRAEIMGRQLLVPP